MIGRCAGALAIGALLAVVSPAAAIELQPVGEFDQPTYLTAPAGDHERLFVTEREGRIRVIENGRVRRAPFLDISNTIDVGQEGGLLSIAFDPRYERNGLLYTFSSDLEGDIRIDEFKRSAGGSSARRASRRTVLQIPHPESNNHYGGQLQFTSSRRLFISTGDGGSANDPPNNAQNPQSLLGKLLRIDPHATGLAPYSIPPGNPFADGVSARPEIFATGLRNPYRFSIDHPTDRLLISDVGQMAREEVNTGTIEDLAGGDFGWRCREGSIPTPGVPPCEPRGGRVDPFFDYGRSGGCSITGGYVVRDKRLGSLVGRYIFGDLCRSALRSVEVPSGEREKRVGIGVKTLVSFGEDAGRCLYTVSLAGPVSKLVPNKKAEPGPC